MTTLAIVVSDLHMGARGPLDRFAHDAAFRAFCKHVADHCRATGDSLRFVLNGDIIDLWTTVPDDELGAADTTNILQRLEYPATTDAMRRKAVRRGTGQVDRILEAHPKVCAGLLDLLETPDPKLVYLVGNHDHGMMFPEVRQHFSDRVGDIGGWNRAADIAFPARYQNKELRLYVEHGQQFSFDSNYQDFNDPTEADMGLYFLRLVGNRVRALYRDKMEGSVLSEIIKYTMAEDAGSTPGITPSLGFLLEYFEARKAGAVPDFSAHQLMQGLYEEWLAQSDSGRPPHVWAAAFRDFFRHLFSGSPAPEYNRQLTASKDGIGLLRTLPIKGRAQQKELHGRVDPYWAGAMHRFSAADFRFPQLDPALVSTVVLGHTHKWKYQDLTAKGVRDGRYFNSGSWTRHNKHPAYVWVSSQDPKTYRGIKHYPL